MKKYLELLLELLRPDNEDFWEQKKLFLAAGKKIEENWNRKLQVFHKCWFIFSAYDELLHDKISLDEFLAIWDITSNKPIASDSQSSIVFLHSIIDDKLENIEDYKDSLFILDWISFWILSESQKQKIQNRVKTQNSEMIFC